jgi:hypothetical protein
MWLKARSRAGFWSLYNLKTNHAVKNNLQKILSISHEAKSSLDSNKENIFAKLPTPCAERCSPPLLKTER